MRASRASAVAAFRLAAGLALLKRRSARSELDLLIVRAGESGLSDTFCAAVSALAGAKEEESTLL